jgi:hypothetical protein
VSLLAPPLRGLLAEAGDALAKLRSRLGVWTNHAVGDRWREFLRGQGAEPREPVLAGLRRIDEAAHSLGDEQIRRLEDLDAKLAEHGRLLQQVLPPDVVRSAPAVTEAPSAKPVSHEGLGTIAALLLLALALGGINATLLSVFFREFIGARSPLPALFPELQMGQVLAVLFFILEVASGWLIFRFGPIGHDDAVEGGRKRTGPEIFFYGSAWVLLASLATIETIAYAVLSDRLNIPLQLKIAPESAFYGITRYFFALFGVGLTLALAAVGHGVADAQQRRRRSRAERRRFRAHATLAVDAARARACVTAIRQAANDLPASVAQALRDALNLSQPYPGSLSDLYAAAVAVVYSTAPGTTPGIIAPGLPCVEPPPVRTPTQVLADLCVHLAMGIVLGVITVLSALEVRAWVAARPTPLTNALAWAAGIGVPGSCIALGMAARNALSRLRYATPLEQALPERRGRRVYGMTVVGIIVLAAAVLAGLAANGGILVGGLIFSILLGTFQAGVLVALGTCLDGIFVALAHAGYLAWLGAVQVISVLTGLVVLVLEAVLGLAAFLVRLLAVPGDVMILMLRTRATPIPAPPVP